MAKEHKSPFGLDLMTLLQAFQLLILLKLMIFQMNNSRGKHLLLFLIPKLLWKYLITNKTGKRLFLKIPLIVINTIMLLRLSQLLPHTGQLRAPIMKLLILLARTFNALTLTARIYMSVSVTQTMEFM